MPDTRESLEICIDEAGSTIAMTREYGRAPRGQAVRDVRPRNRGTVITMIGALTTSGLTAMMTIRGGTDADVFEAYVEHILVPELRAGDIVMLDNLGAHRTKRVQQLVEEAGATLWFTPPYSPEFNPIELATHFPRLAGGLAVLTRRNPTGPERPDAGTAPQRWSR